MAKGAKGGSNDTKEGWGRPCLRTKHGDQELLSIARHGGELGLNPAVDARVEEVEREGAA